MSLLQIYSVIALLLAFNVPSAKVNDIRVILEKSAITAGVQIPVTPQRVLDTSVPTGGSSDTSYVPPTGVNITNGSAANPTLVAQQLLIVNNSINVLKVQATTNQPIKTFSVVNYDTGEELYNLDAVLIHAYTGSYQYNSAYLSNGIPDEVKFTITAKTDSGITLTSRIYEAFHLTTAECQQYARSSGQTSLDCSVTFVRIATAEAN